MDKKHHITILRIIKLINIIILTVPFAIGWMSYYAVHMFEPYYAKGNYLIIMLFFVLYLTYGHIYDAFLISINRISEIVYSQCLALFFSNGVLYLVCWLLTRYLPAVWPLLFVFAAQFFLSVIWSYMAHRWYFQVFPPKRTIIVYDMRKGMEQLLEEYGLKKKFNIMNKVSAEECLKKQMCMLSGAETVFLCGVHSHERNSILKYCVEHHIEVYMIPRIGDVLVSGARRIHMLHLPILRVNNYNPTIEYAFAKRTFDIFFSGLALIVLSPVLIVTALAIKTTDGGPIFYKQCRLTKDRKKFYMLKFRSMKIDAEKDGVARLSTGINDDRITPVGHIIRKFRIDELPQMVNILRGEMSIVGPRPERPEIAEQYEKELPEFSLRLQAKAGLTGYAQVFGKYNTTPYDKLQMDLMYIVKPGFMEDLRIIFATVKILFIAESTDGIEKGKTNAMRQDMVKQNEAVEHGN